MLSSYSAPIPLPSLVIILSQMVTILDSLYSFFSLFWGQKSCLHKLVREGEGLDASSKKETKQRVGLLQYSMV